MKSIKFLLLSIALITNSAYPIAHIASSLGRCIPHLTCAAGIVISNTYWITKLSDLYHAGHLSKYIDNYITKKAQYRNELPEIESSIQDLLDTYANGENVGIQFEKTFSFHNARASFIIRKIFISHAMHDALKNHNTHIHHEARGTIGHELGHIKNRNFFTSARIFGALSTSFCLYVFLKSSLFTNAHWSIKPLIFLFASFTKIISDGLINHYLNKKDEYYADQNVIWCAKDPEDLRGFASSLQAITKPDYVHHHLSIYEHPLVRAEKFEKAADELEKRLSQQKSL